MSEIMRAFGVATRYKAEGDLGIEVEVEGGRLPHPETFWRCEIDPSLRGESVEYVLREPLNFPECCKALDVLDKAYEDNNTVVHESVRAGVHVHVNVQKLSLLELFSFITAYVILEDLLIKYCGEYREGNLFCLRTRDAEFLLHTIEQVAKTKDYHAFGDEVLRYSSMNVCSLSTYGSLEFRAMRGTRDLNLIKDWAGMLLSVRDVAASFDSPAEILSFLEVNGAQAFITHFLGDYARLVEGFDKMEELIQDGLIRVTPLVRGTDWKTFLSVTIGGLSFPVGTAYPDEPLEDY